MTKQLYELVFTADIEVIRGGQPVVDEEVEEQE